MFSVQASVLLFKVNSKLLFRECQANDWKNGHKRVCKKPVAKFYTNEFDSPSITVESNKIEIKKRFICGVGNLYDALTLETIISVNISLNKELHSISSKINSRSGWWVVII